MTKVSITRQKLDDLAVAVAVKSHHALPMTIAEMQTAVSNIPTPTTPTLVTKSISQNGTYTASSDNADGYSSVTVNVPSGTPTLQSKSVSVTPTESTQSQTVSPDSGYDGLSSVDVSVGAIASDYIGSGVTRKAAATYTPSETEQSISAGQYLEGQQTISAISSTYVGGGITRRSGADLTASGATVTVPSGYYEAQASKAVASGSCTPTATKGTVSNHSISVTPSVTNDSGFIDGGTHTGTAVTVSASELVSGTLTVDSSGTKDVTNYASASIPAGTEGTPTASKGTASDHSVTVTPSVENTAGFITGGTKTGTGVTVSASELVSGTYSVTSSGTKDVTNYASASIPSGTEGTPTATKGTVSNHSVTVTPSVTNGSGFITGGTHSGTAVTVSASELVSGSQTISQNGTTDVTNLASVTVNIPFVTYYTGTTDPPASLGNDGDIYLKVVS